MRFAAALLATAVSAGSITQKFMHYLVQFNKSYLTQSEFAERLQNYAATDAFIQSENEVQSSYTVAHNMFSDFSKDEKAMLAGRKTNKGVSQKSKVTLDT
jgi:hypothetical protein